MNKKKSVIFYISNNKQFYSEFHENTKVRMLKSYVKDISHIEDFQLMLNGEVLQDDEISLREISYTRNDLVFKVVQQANSAITELTGEFTKENNLLRIEIEELNRKLDLLYEENSKIAYSHNFSISE
jgi:hypothetical protein